MSASHWLIVNPASGSYSAAAVADLRGALAGAGTAVDRTIACDRGLPTRAEVEAGGVRLVSVFAGDGTVNSVATALEGWSGALLVLPGGTANLLAGALHGDVDAPTIAARLPELVRLRRGCIRYTGGTALAEILAGPGATWSDVREELRDAGVAGLAGKTVAALRDSTAGPLVRLADPALGRADGYAGIRLAVAGQAMEVEGYGAQTIGDYLRQGLALLRRNFRDGPHDELGFHRAVACRSAGDDPMALMVDGERREGRAEERFSLAPFALDLLGTAP